MDTLLGINISPKNGTFEDDFPFPKVGYVNSLEGNIFRSMGQPQKDHQLLAGPKLVAWFFEKVYDSGPSIYYRSWLIE